MLARLEAFQRGDDIVPLELKGDNGSKRVKQRIDPNTKESMFCDDLRKEDGGFYSFRPSVYNFEDAAAFCRPMVLGDTRDILNATQMCPNTP
ncbi:hypothetical protein F5B22DRAFT_206308 [Xylaria bambusicola]|uniref:uncharacterized protein n=1 Tax=Xylaria bambusicola TaxID=326684 RepID=UPI002007CA47|nr:uncharacterized protein F5B22DRAFT_206308 [Xylaria bambusicola]KAI0515185.1 hypothetical protein F5B22DRAFT_206308 [Xylaria bambusicola]